MTDGSSDSPRQLPSFETDAGATNGVPVAERAVASGPPATARTGMLVTLASVVSICFLWLTTIPLGVPGEWTWQRFSVHDIFDSVLGMSIAVLAAAAYVVWVWCGALRIEAAGRFERAVWLSSLVIAGFVWLLVVQQCPPPEHRRLKSTWVLYDPASSGYYFEAVYGRDDVGSFLAGYVDRMARGDVLHEGTHPPGLYLIHRGLVALCEAWPGFSRVVNSTRPPRISSSFATVERGARFAARGLTSEERAALWLASLLTQLTAAATVIPLYALLRCTLIRTQPLNGRDNRTGRDSQESTPEPNGLRGRQSRRFVPSETGSFMNLPRRTAWLLTALWPLVPGVAIFLPKSDAVYPFFFTLLLALWLRTLERQSMIRALATGFVAWIGMLLSLAVIPVLAIVTLATLIFWWRESETPGRTGIRLLYFCAVAVSVFVFATALASLFCEISLPHVWAWNYRNHAAFYGEFHRTWWKWLLVNPLEFAMAAGAPVAVFALQGSFRGFRTILAGKRRCLTPLALSALIVWTLLWLSGKNMGEAGRLWLFAIPWLIWIAAIPESGHANSLRGSSMRTLLLAVALQAIVSMVTVGRISGFEF